MLPHDRIIFGEKNPNIHIQSMNDDINGTKQLWIRLKKQEETMYILLPDLQTKPIDVKGVITRKAKEIPAPFEYLKQYISESKLKNYLENVGIYDIIGLIDRDNSPIDVDKYFEQ